MVDIIQVLNNGRTDNQTAAHSVSPLHPRASQSSNQPQIESIFLMPCVPIEYIQTLSPT